MCALLPWFQGVHSGPHTRRHTLVREREAHTAGGGCASTRGRAGRCSSSRPGARRTELGPQVTGGEPGSGREQDQGVTVGFEHLSEPRACPLSPFTRQGACGRETAVLTDVINGVGKTA